MISLRDSFEAAFKLAAAKRLHGECMALAVPSAVDVLIELRPLWRSDDDVPEPTATDVRCIAALLGYRLCDSSPGDSGRVRAPSVQPIAAERLVP